MLTPHLKEQIVFKKLRKILQQWLVHPWPYRIVRMALAALFIYAGIVKIIDPKAFAAIISTYDLVPGTLLPVVAIGLPLIAAVSLGLMMWNPGHGG